MISLLKYYRGIYWLHILIFSVPFDQKSFVGNLSLSSSRAIAVADIFGKAGIYNDRISAEGKVFEKIDNKKIGKLTRLQRREMPEEELVHILINRLPQD